MNGLAGLRFVFGSDQSPKFTGDSSESGTESDSKWQVAGHFDFLTVDGFASLEDLDNPLPVEPEKFWDAPTELSLYPDSDQDLTSGFYESVRARRSPDENPFLCILQLTLSPTAYELGQNFDSIFKAIDAATVFLRRYVSESKCALDVRFFRTLGRSDLVLVALPTTPRQLQAFDALSLQARELTLAELSKLMVPPYHAEAPGHAFAMAESTLCFRVNSDVFSTPEFIKEEQDVELAFHFRIRVDCGHEVPIINDLKKNYNAIIPCEKNRQEIRITWGSHTIHGVFCSFTDFISVWKNAWFRKNWREANIIDTITYISFPVTAGLGHSLPHCVVWRLNEKVRADLETIEKRLRHFGERFLGPTQRLELVSVFLTFKSCFFRHEFIGTARDLFPFFWQLSEMFKTTVLWEHFFKDEEGACWELFSEDMRDLLSFTQRAVRNRIEHRSMQSDPPTPHTLHHGACKLVSAYSALFWLCSELFRLDSNSGRPEYCTADHFAACVSIGHDGRVVCLELFERFRRFVEEDRRCSLSSSGGGWTSRLVVIQISGKTLLRPELCFVHCLHEAAEISEWLLQPRCEPLRIGLNKWVFDEALSSSVHACGESARGALVLFLKFLVVAQNYSSEEVPKITEASLASIEEKYEAIAASNHPEDLAQKFQWLSYDIYKYDVGCIDELSVSWNNEEIRRLRNVWGKLCDLMHGPEGEFYCQMESVRDLATELCADVGMICSFDHIATSLTPEGRGNDARFKDLSRIYLGLLAAVEESRGIASAVNRVVSLVVYRWAIQSAAIKGDTAEANMESILDASTELSSDLKERIKSSLRVACEAISPCSEVSIPAALRSFQAYGGKTELGFPAIERLGVPEQMLLDAFWRTWRSNGNPKRQLEFATSLWAKSERMRFARILEAVT